VLALAATLGLSGCEQLRPRPAETYVYVTAKQAYLRDRVAAVSNRTAEVSVGQRLVVLDHARMWVKVRTEKGETGWLQKKDTADQSVVDEFDGLAQQHAHDPVVAKATARDEVVLHIAPGRKTEFFYRLAEGDSVGLLRRATLEKAVAPGAAPVAKAENAAAAPPEPVFEDWWLVRDGKGHTGWVYSHLIDVSAPDALTRYAEGQRIVAAYVLAYADDPDSGVLDNGSPVTRIPEYVTVLSPYKAGLPYDFDQVRVFTWNVKKHRYETAFREHNVAGYLPVTTEPIADPYGKAANAAEKLPGFTYHVLAGDQAMPTPDPVNGELTPGKTVAKTYRLEGNICRRIIQPGTQPPAEAHPEAEPEKKKEKNGKKK
jgi:SH3-like domain-containing protein